MNIAIIGYKNKWFWINYRFVELLSKYFHDTMSTAGAGGYSDHMLKFFKYCEYNMSGLLMDSPGFEFDKIIISQEDKLDLQSILLQTRNNIAAIGAEVDLVSLNNFENTQAIPEVKDEWTIPVKTQSLVKTIDTILELVVLEDSPNKGKTICFQGYAPLTDYDIIF